MRREPGPVVECDVANNPQAQVCRTAVRLQRNCEADGGALVLLEDAADLPVQRRRVETLLRAGDASGQALEPRRSASPSKNGCQLLNHSHRLGQVIHHGRPPSGLGLHSPLT
jgi:hypothetical protein